MVENTIFKAVKVGAAKFSVCFACHFYSSTLYFENHRSAPETHAYTCIWYMWLTLCIKLIKKLQNYKSVPAPMWVWYLILEQVLWICMWNPTTLSVFLSFCIYVTLSSLSSMLSHSSFYIFSPSHNSEALLSRSLLSKGVIC